LLPENGNWDSFPKGCGKAGVGREGGGGQWVPPVPPERFLSLLFQVRKMRATLPGGEAVWGWLQK